MKVIFLIYFFIQPTRTQEKAFEIVWDASSNLSPERCEIFTHIIKENYGDITGLGFDWDNPNSKR